MCAAMRDKLGRQMFEVAIQAAASGKVVARETLKVCLHATLFKAFCCSAGLCHDNVATLSAQFVSIHLALKLLGRRAVLVLLLVQLCMVCLIVVDA